MELSTVYVHKHIILHEDRSYHSSFVDVFDDDRAAIADVNKTAKTLLRSGGVLISGDDESGDFVIQNEETKKFHISNVVQTEMQNTN